MHRLANALVARGHSCTCFSFSPRPDDARYAHKQLTYGWGGTLRKKFDPARCFKRVTKDAFDIIHYHGDDYLSHGSPRRVRTFYGSALSEALNARKLSRFLYQGLFYCLEWISCLRTGAKVGISKATARALPLVHTVIPCGVPGDTYVPGTVKSRHPSILFLGDLNSRKRGNYLIQLFTHAILKRYPDCTLTIVGPQPCEGDGIVYAGNLSEQALIEAYQRAWVYCMPSSYEGFGVPAIEAMACGTAVVAVDNPGIREIIHTGYNGLHVSDTHLVQGIDQVLSDRDLRETLAHNGRKTVERMFDIQLIAEKYERLYSSLLS